MVKLSFENAQLNIIFFFLPNFYCWKGLRKVNPLSIHEKTKIVRKDVFVQGCMNELKTEKSGSESKTLEFGEMIVQSYPNLRRFCFSSKKQPSEESMIIRVVVF